MLTSPHWPDPCLSHRVPVVLLFPHRVRSLALPLAGMRRARADTGAGHDAGQGVAAAFDWLLIPRTHADGGVFGVLQFIIL